VRLEGAVGDVVGRGTSPLSMPLLRLQCLNATDDEGPARAPILDAQAGEHLPRP
jgi:hypothetical protein